MTMDLNEKKEIIASSYEKTYDLEMAFEKAEVTDEERKALSGDKDFQKRLRALLIAEREDIIKHLKEFKDAENEKIAYEATKDLGKLLYKEFFIGIDDKTVIVKDDTANKEEKDRISKEYNHLLNGQGNFDV